MTKEDFALLVAVVFAGVGLGMILGGAALEVLT